MSCGWGRRLRVDTSAGSVLSVSAVPAVLSVPSVGRFIRTSDFFLFPLTPFLNPLGFPGQFRLFRLSVVKIPHPAERS